MPPLAMAAFPSPRGFWKPSSSHWQGQWRGFRGRMALDLDEQARISLSRACKSAGIAVVALFFSAGVSLSENPALAAPAVVESSSVREDCASSSLAGGIPDASSSLEVTDESLVESAWELVNDFYLDARHHKWSPDLWLAQKEKVFQRPFQNRKAAYSAIREMLATLDDPFTRFLTPDEFSQTSKYDITGVGLNIGEVPDENGQIQLRVLGIVLQSPAELAGIQQRKGTPVSVEVRRSQCGDVQSYVLYRQQDLRSPVFYRLERSDVANERRGYVRLKEFNALTKRDLVTALMRLQASGASSFVLDLRDNLGGLVQEGIEVAKLFLDDGETVIYTTRRNNASLQSIVAKGQPFLRAPLVVLVNNRTASASEIMAAALHDNCRAVLAGSRTFGKGLIQSVFEFNDGSGVILTVGKYMTPAHRDIDGNGLEPDFWRMPGHLEVEQKLRACLSKKAS
ncbi:carboxyl-terminal-processing peptidase 1, chloroplastic [Selaginella moellendorffii]|uniref:carboxyl-terminal-processing peptidase 1, chloroplastic n=1 Tax=Selaginella moellendorffii TaxID=88036 RepID=UPI000D1CEE76|nr:carboxyl-terminal-processing peptidase 1, chloroplastic [Selaginella moellendorffii]|eukprot:XP_024529080.1 carboxyl-terminal-processing peptidase 1, chloroplastic [Selaginella moellendorffii]